MQIVYANKDLYPEFSINFLRWENDIYYWAVSIDKFATLTINFNIIKSRNKLYLSSVDFIQEVNKILWEISYQTLHIQMQGENLRILWDQYDEEYSFSLKQWYEDEIEYECEIKNIQLLSKNTKNISWIKFPCYQQYIHDIEFLEISYKEYDFQQYEQWFFDEYILHSEIL